MSNSTTERDMNNSTTESVLRYKHVSNGTIWDEMPVQNSQMREYRSNGKDKPQIQIQNGHDDDKSANANMGCYMDPTDGFCYRVYEVMEQDAKIADLTDDLLYLVFSFLDQHSLCASAMVCRQWHSVSMCEEFWQSLSFEGDGATAEKVGWLCMKYPKAVGLSLKDVPCVDEVAREAMFCLQWLERLILHKGNLTDCFFSALSHGCYALNELTITDTKLGNEGSEEVIICHETLHKLQILKCYAIKVTIRCPMLDKLSLKGTNISTAKLQCPVLHSLDMSSCHNLSDESLCSTITGCPALLNLDVSQCACINDYTLQKISLSCLNLRNLIVLHCPKVSNETVSLEVLNGMRSLNLPLSRSTSTVTRSYYLMFKTVGWDPAAFLTSVFLDLNLLKNVTFNNCDRLLNLMLHFRPVANIHVPRYPSLKHNSTLLASTQRLPIQPQMLFTLHSKVDLATRFSSVRGVCHRLSLPVTTNFKMFKYLPVIVQSGRPGTVCWFPGVNNDSQSPVFLPQNTCKRFLLQDLASKCIPDVDVLAIPSRVCIFSGGKVCQRSFVSPSLKNLKNQDFRFLPNFVHTSLSNIIKERSVLAIQDFHKQMFWNNTVAPLSWHFQVTQMNSNEYLIPFGLEFGTMPLFWNLLTNDSKYKPTVYGLQCRRYINNVQLQCRYYISKRSIINVQLQYRYYHKQIPNSSEPSHCVQLLDWNIQKILNSLHDVACRKSVWNPFMLNAFLLSEKMQFNVELCYFLSWYTAMDEFNTIHEELSTRWLQFCSPKHYTLKGMLQEDCSLVVYLPGKVTILLRGYYINANPFEIVEESPYMEIALNFVSETSTPETVNGEVIPCIQLMYMILRGPLNLLHHYNFCHEIKSNTCKFLYEITGAYWNDPCSLEKLESCSGTWLNHDALEYSSNPSCYETTFYLTSHFQHEMQKTEYEVPCSVSLSFVQCLKIINHPGVQIAVMKAICLWNSFANIRHIKEEFLYLTVLYFCEYIALQELLLAFSTLQPWAFNDISQTLSIMQLIDDSVL